MTRNRENKQFDLGVMKALISCLLRPIPCIIANNVLFDRVGVVQKFVLNKWENAFISNYEKAASTYERSHFLIGYLHTTRLSAHIHRLLVVYEFITNEAPARYAVVTYESCTARVVTKREIIFKCIWA